MEPFIRIHNFIQCSFFMYDINCKDFFKKSIYIYILYSVFLKSLYIYLFFSYQMNFFEKIHIFLTKCIYFLNIRRFDSNPDEGGNILLLPEHSEHLQLAHCNLKNGSHTDILRDKDIFGCFLHHHYIWNAISLFTHQSP